MALKHLLKIILFVSLFVLILVFLTPLSSWLAKPLIIAPSIQNGDAILVLSGGSYPNGQLSSFSLERTVQGVKLYRDGFSNKIIFSGKGQGESQDALFMKSTAMSLGVKEEDIVTENQSVSTYENILYSTRIIKEKGYSKILLVTSPIHVRRSMMIAGKISPEIQLFPASFNSYDEYRSHPLDRLILFWFTIREYAGIIVESFRR